MLLLFCLFYRRLFFSLSASFIWSYWHTFWQTQNGFPLLLLLRNKNVKKTDTRKLENSRLVIHYLDGFFHIVKCELQTFLLQCLRAWIVEIITLFVLFIFAVAMSAACCCCCCCESLKRVSFIKCIAIGMQYVVYHATQYICDK